MTSALPPFAAWTGPRQPRILLLGEAWGESEAEAREPFVGWSGRELFVMLGNAKPDLWPEEHARIRGLFNFGAHPWRRQRGAWLEAASVAMTNAFALRPTNNKIEELCVDKKSLPSGYSFPALGTGRYLDPRYFPELRRMWDEIEEARPNIIIALGNTAAWALLGVTGIGKIRGTITQASSPLGSKWKVLPTFHPAGILRQWSNRPIAVADLGKGFHESGSSSIVRPARRVHIHPTLAECEAFLAQVLATPPATMAIDCETSRGQITTIGFAPSPDYAFVVPFWDQSKPGWSYWDDSADERRAWTIVAELCAVAPVVGQNFLYDMQYINPCGITKIDVRHDTMLRHHARFPELQKGLGFLGSVYTSEPAWKLMRRVRKADELKKDE